MGVMRKEATPKLRCSSSSVFLSTAGIGCQDLNRDLEMEKDLEREDMTLAGQFAEREGEVKEEAPNCQGVQVPNLPLGQAEMTFWKS